MASESRRNNARGAKIASSLVTRPASLLMVGTTSDKNRYTQTTDGKQSGAIFLLTVP